MKVINTIFVVLIILLAIFTWIYGSKALTIRREWNTSIQKLQKRIEENKIKLQTVFDGSDPNKAHDQFREFGEMRLGELINRLDVMVEERGNAWFGCTPRELKVRGAQKNPNQLGDNYPQTQDDKLQPLYLAEISIEISNPVDNSGGANAVFPQDELGGTFYIIDEGKDGNGTFLGRFTIAPNSVSRDANKTQLILHSATDLSDAEVELIKNGMDSFWTIYSLMPRDRFEDVFDRIKKDDLDRIVPSKTMADNLTKSDRDLVDFDVVLTSEYLKYIKLNNRKKLHIKNIADLKITLEQMKKEGADVSFACDLENKRIKLMQDQFNAVKKVLDGYNSVIEHLQNSIAKTQKENEWYASKIAEMQLESLQIIEKHAEAAVNNIE
ncbi:MAG: hypothetical protein LBK06_03090 [Planctomycetaceae bacterium]|jgi:cell division protein FtsL|nr:hypothetical protein [Planctomycetaceae bacterium]